MDKRLRSIVWITAGAIALYLTMRSLPTGTNLEHADFQSGSSALELCSANGPQFMPVSEVKSPVSTDLKTGGAAQAGEVVHAQLVMKTASGKVIGANDLLVFHTEKLHLLIVDASLQDYQHVHPLFDAGSGAWKFSFTPKFGGVYRIFCDFVPAATGREIYASADVRVEGRARSPSAPKKTDSYRGGLGETALPSEAQSDFVLTGTAIAQRQTTLQLSAAHAQQLEPVMGAYAHLVAFDSERNGFAHLHPVEIDKSTLPLTFKVKLPRSGDYAIWAQMRLNGRDVFVPFKLTVLP